MNTTHDKRFIRGNQTMQTLIEVGKKIWIRQENLREITIDEICRRCAMTKGAFYHHFVSKDDFFARIGGYVLLDHMVQIIQESDIAHPDQPAAQIRDWIIGITDYAECYRDSIGLFYRITTLDNRSQYISPWRDAVQNHLIRWQEAKLIRTDVSIQELHDYIDTFTYGTFILTAQQYIQAPHNDKLISSFVETLLCK